MKITLYDCDICGKRFEVKGDAIPIPVPSVLPTVGSHACRDCVSAVANVTVAHRRELALLCENLQQKTESPPEDASA